MGNAHGVQVYSRKRRIIYRPADSLPLDESDVRALVLKEEAALRARGLSNRPASAPADLGGGGGSNINNPSSAALHSSSMLMPHTTGGGGGGGLAATRASSSNRLNANRPSMLMSADRSLNAASANPLLAASLRGGGGGTHQNPLTSLHPNKNSNNGTTAKHGGAAAAGAASNNNHSGGSVALGRSTRQHNSNAAPSDSQHGHGPDSGGYNHDAEWMYQLSHYERAHKEREGAKAASKGK